MCVQWAVEKPGILTKAVKGNPSGSDLVFGAWSSKWGTHSGLFVYPSPCSGLSKAITWFPLLLSHVTVSKISQFEGLKLGRPWRHCLRTGVIAWIKTELWRFLLRVSNKIPALQTDVTTQDKPNKSADLTAVSSLPQGDVVIRSNQPGFKWAPNTQKAAGRKMIRHSFHRLAWSALRQLVWGAGALLCTVGLYSWFPSRRQLMREAWNRQTSLFFKPFLKYIISSLFSHVSSLKSQSNSICHSWRNSLRFSLYCQELDEKFDTMVNICSDVRSGCSVP